MDTKKVKEVIELMKENDLVEIEIVDGESKIHLKRPQAQTTFVQQVPMAQPAAPAAEGVSATPSTPAQTSESSEQSGFIEIKSPIVGTFYQASSPEADPYVTIGSKVEHDSIVCIIEAMKVMNEIKAEVGGTIVEVCAKDGQAIEYGQVLFRVRP